MKTPLLDWQQTPPLRAGRQPKWWVEIGAVYITVMWSDHQEESRQWSFWSHYSRMDGDNYPTAQDAMLAAEAWLRKE
jgi:hypothetical protein